MELKPDKLLHYVLIVMLMIMPLRGVMARGVMALPQSHCDMAAESTDMSMSGSVNDSVHGSTDMSMQADQDGDKADSANHCCCCDNGCADNCDMGVSLSILMQFSLFSQIFGKLTASPDYSPEVIVRTLSPPSRPPAQYS